MIDLFPPDVITDLQERFGIQFDQLKDEERMALALAGSEGTLNHARLCTVSSMHPVELTRTLQHLTQLGMLESTGAGRGAVYHLPGSALPTPDEVFGPTPMLQLGNSSDLESSSSVLAGSSSALESSSSVLGGSSSDLHRRNPDGYLLSDQLPLPVINDLQMLSTVVRARLEMLAAEPRKKKKMDKTALEQVIITLCEGHYLTLQTLALLLNRKPDSLRNGYLTPMVRNKTLSLAFPATPTHERQAYCTTHTLPNTLGNK